jgi:hypothetical protein
MGRLSGAGDLCQSLWASGIHLFEIMFGFAGPKGPAAPVSTALWVGLIRSETQLRRFLHKMDQSTVGMAAIRVAFREPKGRLAGSERGGVAHRDWPTSQLIQHVVPSSTSISSKAKKKPNTVSVPTSGSPEVRNTYPNARCHQPGL